MNEYETPDFGLAAFLVARERRMVRNRKEGRRVFFTFADVDDDVKEYRFGDAMVSAHKILSAQKQLRSIIYDDFGTHGK